MHPSAVWVPGREGRDLAVLPEWEQCAVCREIGRLEAAGPPHSPDEAGWHIVLVPREEVRRRAGLKPQ